MRGLEEIRVVFWTDGNALRAEFPVRLEPGVLKGFPIDSDSKESACDAGDLDSIPGLERSSGEENGCPFHYFCLENSMDRRACWATVHGVAESDTTEWLTNTLTSFSVWLSQVWVKHGWTEELQRVFMDFYSDGNEDPLANIFVCQGWGDHIKFEFWKIYLAALWNVTWEEMWSEVVRRIHRWK